MVKKETILLSALLFIFKSFFPLYFLFLNFFKKQDLFLAPIILDIAVQRPITPIALLM